MRLFVAVNISDEMRQGIEKVQEKLKKILTGVKWVSPDKMHITLKFLGEVEEERLSDIYNAMESAARGTKPFKVSAAVSGEFPSASHPRVVWADVTEGGEGLAALAAALEENLAGFGFSREERAFTPHLTLGRAHAIHSVEALSKNKVAVGNEQVGSFSVKTIELMQSVMGPKGAQYTCLKSISI